jgi:hypothetical protein
MSTPSKYDFYVVFMKFYVGLLCDFYVVFMKFYVGLLLA